jgi:hypothetical protein
METGSEVEILELLENRRGVLEGTELLDLEARVKLKARQEGELGKLKEKVTELRNKVKNYTKARPDNRLHNERKNALRKVRWERDRLQAELDAGVEVLSHEKLRSMYSDGYPAVLLKHPPNPQMLLGRIYEVGDCGCEGEVFDECGQIMVHIENRLSNRFIAGDLVWVEPHPMYVGKWQLVGEYNFRGKRIG